MIHGTGLGTLVPLCFYLMVISAVLLSLLRNPDYGLYLLVLIIPLQTTREKLIAFPLGAQTIDLLWVSVFLGVMFRKHERLIPKTKIIGILAALAIVSFLSFWRGWIYFGADLPGPSFLLRLSSWKNYMVLPIIGLVVAAAVRDKKQIKFLVFLMVLSTCLVNWSFFRSAAGRDFSHFSEGVRDAGVLGYADVNGFAAYIAQIMVFLSAMFFFVRRKSYKFALAALLGFSCYCLLFSFSRGGYAACFAGLAFIALFRQKKLLVGLVLLVVAWQVVLPTAVRERISMTTDKNGRIVDTSAEERITIWEDAVNLIGQNPIGGSGFDTYEFMHRVGPYSDTHNYYLKVLVEMGFIGFFLLLAILLQMWRLGFKLFTSASDPFLQALGLGFAGLVICAAVANIFGDRWTYLQVDGYTWVLMGCVIKAQQIVRERATEQREVREPVPIRRGVLTPVPAFQYAATENGTNPVPSPSVSLTSQLLAMEQNMAEQRDGAAPRVYAGGKSLARAAKA